MVGRGRPFVGGEANAFNFAPFAGTEAYASFPSAHAITGFALAFAVSARVAAGAAAMIVYAVLIALSRLVLLAHHPSDVVAGALIGVIGAMAGALLVRRPPPRASLSVATAKLCRSGAASRPAQKGCPRGRQPHKKRTLQTAGSSGSAGGGPTQTVSVDLPSSDTAAVAVSIVVPVRNEAENVAPLIAEIAAALDGRWAYEIIYVNDGSTDATAERLAALMKQRGNLRQIRHAARRASRRRCAAACAPRAAPSWRRSTATARTIRRSCRI